MAHLMNTREVAEYLRIKERKVYIYESTRFPGYAFYATPITDIEGESFAHYYDDGTGRPFITSVRKDTDGDGVSDFWEMALGTNFEDSNDKPTGFPDDNALFKDLSALSPLELADRLGWLDDASALKDVRNLGDFNATSGL